MTVQLGGLRSFPAPAVAGHTAKVTARCICALALLLIAGDPALAHVKWFAQYDLTLPPMPIGDVLNKVFIAFFLLSVVAVYFFFVVDRFAYRKHFLELILIPLHHFGTDRVPDHALRDRRFFAAVSVWGFSGDAFYLTPELKTNQWWVPWLQAALALCALHRWTMALMAVGMAVLYGAAIRQIRAVSTCSII